MKINLKLIFFSFAVASCTPLLLGDDPGNSPADIFEQFWKGVDETWPEFATKKVNWDSLHQVYRPVVDAAKTDAAFYQVMQELLYNLRDTHTSIFPKGQPIMEFPLKSASNFYGFNWIQSHYLTSYKGNHVLLYGLMKNVNIGYMYVSNFSTSIDQYEIIDEVLRNFSTTKGIIIDVRNNGGGSSSNSETIASRFADQTRTYAYARFRTGPIKTIMGDYVAEEISPVNASLYAGRVAILTNGISFSATEDFILMMKSFPQVIQVGENTGGGSGTRPIIKELPAGWSYRVSTKLLCDLNYLPITKGIPPNILASTTKSDSLNGKDRIIETAITEINKP